MYVIYSGEDDTEIVKAAEKAKNIIVIGGGFTSSKILSKLTKTY